MQRVKHSWVKSPCEVALHELHLKRTESEETACKHSVLCRVEKCKITVALIFLTQKCQFYIILESQFSVREDTSQLKKMI